MIKPLFILIFTVLFAVDSTCQKLDHVLGEILVQIPNNENVHLLKRKLQSKMELPVEISFEQLISEPMNIWSVKVNPNTTNENLLLRHLRSIDIVLNAQKNHITHLRQVPNDTRFDQQWQYVNDGSNGGVENADLDMDLAWDITTGGVTAQGDTIVVCIVDNGLNIDHPDMQGNVWTNHGEIPNNNIDDDNNGYIDDYNGWNAINNNGNVNQGGSHGTPVTGIIGAKGNNELGVAGVNWDVKTMMVVGGSPESTAIASYAYAYSQRKRYNESDGAEGAFVVATNSSWGVDNGQPEDAPIWCDFYNILGSEGIISCGATANRNYNIDETGDLPTACSSPYLISVTNINRSDTKEQQAGYGLKTIDLGAYGEDTYTISSNHYTNFGGTSGATPHVAGVVALAHAVDCPEFMELVKSRPALAALAIKDVILYGNVPLENLEGISVTGGKLNANNSLLNLTSICNSSCTEAYGVTAVNVDIFESTMSNFKNSNQGNVTLRYRITGTQTWTEVNDQSIPFDLTDLEACTVYEFQSATICSDTLGQYSYIKEFKTGGCCESPIINEILVEDNIATVSWTNTPVANQYTLEYKKQASTEWNTLEVDEETLEISIPNLEECTLYDVRVKATCEISERESEFYMTTFSGECGNCTADYCQIPAKNTVDEWIASVSIAGVFENTSGNNDGRGIFIGAFSIQLKQNQTYEMTLTPGYTATNFSEHFEVYLDANQDGEFQEEELLLANESAASEAFTSDFTVMPTSLLGITRLRIIMRYDIPNNSGCDSPSWEFGEYEEYCVEILADDTECPEELEIVSEIDSTESTLRFSLTHNTLVSTYNIGYRETGQSEYTNLVFMGNAILLNDLEKCTEYELIFSGTCIDGNQTIESTAMLKTKCSLSTWNAKPSEISIYPSPSDGPLHINTPDGIKLTSVRIFDIHGKMVFTSDKTILNMGSQLSTGVYFIQINSNENAVVRKWVKL